MRAIQLLGFYFLTVLLFMISFELFAQRTSEPIIVKADSVETEFIGYSELDKMPLVYSTHNLNAAKSIGTNQVWTGGNLNLNLTGENKVVGVWDGGAVRLTHQELIGRVTQVDGATSLSNHATHVAGTMGAAGVYNSAKGMAFEADIDAYDWNSDESEMIAAASNGLLVSNHSYGLITGWYHNPSDGMWYWYGNVSASQTEDYKFGFYSPQARYWDQIAYDAPYYLIVKSAGNDRNDNGPNAGTPHKYHNGFGWVLSNVNREKDGGIDGYDCISHAGVSKNVLTVGAVYDIPNGYSQPSDVVMSSFSSWGKTDDGRIKPDIVANGIGLLSPVATGDTQYSNFSGTSMSSPSVSGSLILLQEHYQNLYGGSMKAATLKALVIHTADEAGIAEGPDYQFGWGLMNPAKAVTVIENSSLPTDDLIEAHLQNNGTYNLTINSDGTSPLVATLSWTDVAGTVPPVSLNPTTLMLVNDLDMCLTHTTTGETFHPYILNPNNPDAAATTGDNFRDNVEKIYLAAPTAGEYTLTISHKNNLMGGNQNFSLILSGMNTSPCAITANFDYSVSDLTVDFSDMSVGADAYSWNFGDGNSSTEANPSHAFAENGTYNVCLTVSNECGNDTKCEEIVLVSICGGELVEEWQQGFGGSDQDHLRDIELTSDGGYILGGASLSGIDGNKTSQGNGDKDYWIVKIDALGNKQWEKTYGGNGEDYLWDIELTSDGGYILGGQSDSGVNGNKTSQGYGLYDIWIVKIDALGNKQWEKTYGGSIHDYLRKIKLTSDGGYILGGHSSSGISGNKTSPTYGNYDIWIVKVDSFGNKQWEKSYGQNTFETLQDIELTSDGGYIFGGISNSSTISSYGGRDYWIVKIDDLGNEQWEKNYGGSSHDILSDIELISGGGYILGGHSKSGVNGSKTSQEYGDNDYWIVKIDDLGNKQWEKSHGGSNDDSFQDIELTSDGGYILGGYSLSGIDGNKTSEGYGDWDYWIVKVDDLGNKQWEKSYGGSSEDRLYDIELSNNGEYILGGRSDSGIDGNKTSQGYGSYDYWIIKLQESQVDGLSASFTSPSNSCATQNTFFTNTSQNATSHEWFIDNISVSTQTHLNHTFSEAGTYTLRLEATAGACVESYQENIEVLPIPNANFTYTVNGLTVDFSAAYVEEGTTYDWDLGTGNSSSEVNPSRTFPSEGIYNVCLSITTVCGTDSGCQNIQVNSSNPCSTDTWVNYTTGYSVLTTVQEGDYIWFGGQSGLAKMHKTTEAITLYTSANSPLSGNHVTDIEIDSEGNKWIATAQGGLAKFDGANWTLYHPENSDIPSVSISCVTIASNDDILVASGNNLVKFDGTNWTTYDMPVSTTIYDVEIDNSENIWVGTFSGLHQFDGTTWTSYTEGNSMLPENRVRQIAIDSQQNIWLGTDWTHSTSVVKFDGNNTWEITSLGGTYNFIYSLEINNNDAVWVGCRKQYLTKITETETITYSGGPKSSVSYSALYGISFSDDGNVWMGGARNFSGNNALYKLVIEDGYSWEEFDYNNSPLLGKNILSIAVDANNSVWLGGSAGSGVMEFDGTNWVNHYENYDFLKGHICAIVTDDLGNTWALNRWKLAKYDGTDWSLEYGANAGVEPHLTTMTLDSSGDIWIGRRNDNALLKFDDSGITTYDFSSKIIYSIDADNNGNVWVGSSQGLYKYNDTNGSLQSNSCFPYDNVTAVAADNNGNVWVAFRNPSYTQSDYSVVKYDGANCVATYDITNSPLPNSYIRNIHVDEFENVWFHTDSAIAKLNGTNWEVFTVENSGLSGYYSYYDTSLAVDSEGKLWYAGGLYGISMYNPSGSNLKAFFTSPTPICVTEPTTFTNTSENATTYEWFINGESVSTDVDLIHSFPDAGNYEVKLVVSNGDCEDNYTELVEVNSHASQLELGPDKTICGEAETVIGCRCIGYGVLFLGERRDIIGNNTAD